MPAATKPDFAHEDALPALPVCGIDEVGRGPLAGPVVAAAVVLRRGDIPAAVLDQVNDSKKLTAAKREYLFNKLHEYAHVSIAECGTDEIDRINILQATLRAMQKAFDGLDIRPAAALVDGNRAPKLPCAVKTIIGGDGKSLSIAAASIIAKHYRDKRMQSYAIEFPQYGWEKNAGYGTAQHLKAIEIYGVTPLHRRSFSPVSQIILKESNTNN